MSLRATGYEQVWRPWNLTTGFDLIRYLITGCSITLTPKSDRRISMPANLQFEEMRRAAPSFFVSIVRAV